jgi:hypothetical protein
MTIKKGMIGEEDLKWYDGANKTFTRISPSGGVQTLTPFGTPGGQLVGVSSNIGTNVKAYGAVGDGVTDDRAAIQAAINAVYAAGGGALYFPEGSYLLNSFSSSYYTIIPKSGVNVIGSGMFSTIFKIGDNLRSAAQGITIFYDHSNALSNIKFADFTVDWNGANNLVLSGYNVTNRMGGASGCKRIMVESVYFKNSGGAHHLYLSNTANEAAANGECMVTNCIFNNSGTALTGNLITDHTSIYMDAPNSTVSGNIFMMDNLNDLYSTAVDVMDTNISVVGNTCYGYNNFCNVAAQLQDIDSATISGNVANEILHGVMLWNASTYILKNVSITGNSWMFREDTTATQTSLAVWATSTSMAGSNNGSGLNITGNNFRLGAQTDLTTSKIGIYLQRWNDIIIKNNVIEGWTHEGIMIQSENNTKRIEGVNISGNHIRNCGLTSTAANKRAIALVSYTHAATDDIDDVIISQNVINCGAPAGTAATYGIQLNNGRFPNCKILDNEIIGAGTLSIYNQDTTTTDKIIIRGKEALRPWLNIAASMGSEWYDTSTGIFYKAVDATYDMTTFVWRAEMYGSAAPTTGTWIRGDRVINRAPAIGQPKGWVCIEGGTPGTWQSEGSLWYLLNEDLEIRTGGRGIFVINSAGTVGKRARLNDAGDGWTFEDYSGTSPAPSPANLIMSWTNQNFETFVADGPDITSAIETGTSGTANTGYIYGISGATSYTLTYNLTLNSGTAPTASWWDGISSATTMGQLSSGANTKVFTTTAGATWVYISLGVGAASNFACTFSLAPTP